MSSSSKQEINLNLQSVDFFNGTKLGTTNDFSTDVRIRKRLRVDGDLFINGKIPYTDRQTGWGDTEWSFAQSGVYSVKTDSLIQKIVTIENNYATKQYVDSVVTGGTTGLGLIFYDTNVYGQYADPTLNYPYPVTTLVQNSAFIFRDSQSTQMIMKFQKGTPAIGKVLTCQDTDGTVGWADVSSQGSVIADTISSSNGQSNTFTFRVIDIGVSSNLPGVGWSFYPQLSSNAFNKALLANDVALIGGYNGAPSDRRVFIGPYSYGSEGISFKSSYSTTANGTTTNYYGQTRITGGYYNATTGGDQTIQLDGNGILLAPGYNLPINVVLPKVTYDDDHWSKPFSIQGKWNADKLPLFLLSKQNSDGTQNHVMHFNPKLNGGNWNPLVQTGDFGIVFGDYTGFNWTTNSHQYIESTYRLFVGPWSPYHDGISIRPSVESEENLAPPPSVSGYTRIAAGAPGVYALNRYLEVNREGVTLLQSSTSKTVNYGRFDVLTKSGAILNNTDPSQVIGSFNVGSSSYPCVSTFNGNLYIQYGNLYLKPSGNTPTNGKVLTCVDGTGLSIWNDLPTTYSSLNVTTLTAASLDTSEIIFPSMTFFEAGTAGVFYYDNFTFGGSHNFLVTDTIGNKSSPLAIQHSNIFVNKAFKFPDGSQQISAYTGAKALAGSYTNPSITIDSNGQITALSSNPFFLPPEITTPVTFNSSVIFNSTTQHSDSIYLYPPSGTIKSLDLGSNTQLYVNGASFFSSPPTIYSNGIPNQVLQSSTTGLTTWSDSLNLKSLNLTDLVATSPVNPVSYTQFENEVFLENFAVGTGGWDTVGPIPGAMNRNTIYSWWTTELQVGRAAYPLNRHLVQEFIAPIAWYQEWHFTNNLQANDEIMSVNIELTYYKVYIYNSVDVLVDQWQVDLEAPKSVNYYVDRYISSTSNCIDKDTKFKVRVPLSTLYIRWAPPFGSTETYSINVKLFGRWINAGEYLTNTFVSLAINSIGTQESYFVQQQYIGGAQQDPYATTALFLPTQYNCTNMTRNGNSLQPYAAPGLSPTTNLPITNSSPNTLTTFLSLGNIDCNSLTVHSTLTLPYGAVYATGYAGRKGTPLPSNYGTSPYDTTSNITGTTKAWGSIFNFYWTLQGQVQIWVDYTMVHTISPNFCDYRLKLNFSDSPSVLERLCQIPVIIYDRKENGAMPASKNHIGILAHELQEKFEELDHLVVGEKDEVNREGGEVFQTLTNEITFLLLKSIQELKAENDRMKAQIEMLFTLLTPPNL